MDEYIFQGSYKELLATLVLFQTENIPIWLVVENPGKNMLKLHSVNLYGAIHDWLSIHRQRIEAIKTMLDSDSYEAAKYELARMLSDLDETLFALNELKSYEMKRLPETLNTISKIVGAYNER